MNFSIFYRYIVEKPQHVNVNPHRVR